MTDVTDVTVLSGEANEHGYKPFSIGEFNFSRDEHFVHVTWPSGTHVTAAEPFLKALMRDVAWNFFYGTVNFDAVLGTTNHYGNVDLFAGRFNEAYRKAELDHMENFPHDEIKATFTAMLSDWTNATFDPFAAPMETGSAYGAKSGNNDAAVTRTRVTAKRMVGMPDDEPLRTDESGYPVNRAFHDVDQSQPVVEVEPGYENEVSAYNFFAYLSRSDVTWNPSVVSVCKDRGVHPADYPRQRPRRVVHPAERRDHLGSRGPQDRYAQSQGRDEGGGLCVDARRHPPPRLLAEAFDAARVGEQLAGDPGHDRSRRGIGRSGQVLSPAC